MIDLPVVILFGALFACFEDPKRESSVLTSSYFWHGVVFCTLFNFAVLFAALKTPDWMWMYFIDAKRHSVIELIFLFTFLYYLPYALGFYLGFDFKKSSTVTWTAFMIFLLASEVWLIVHLFDRYSAVGTFAQFQNGTAQSLFDPQNPLSLVLNISLGLMVVYFLLIVFLYRRRRKQRQYQSSISF